MKFKKFLRDRFNKKSIKIASILLILILSVLFVFLLNGLYGTTFAIIILLTIAIIGVIISDYCSWIELQKADKIFVKYVNESKENTNNFIEECKKIRENNGVKK